jgi:hypothetical protein
MVSQIPANRTANVTRRIDLGIAAIVAATDPVQQRSPSVKRPGRAQ